MVQIRLAREEDLADMLTIYNDVILHTTAVYEYQPHTLEMRRDWYAAKLKSGFPVFVAVEEMTIVGFGSYGPFRAWAAYQFTVENSVYVAAAFRGKGISKLLMNAIIGSAREKGFHAMVAGIDSDNKASIHLHEQMGFREVALFREVGFKFDRWLDLKFFELLI